MRTVLLRSDVDRLTASLAGVVDDMRRGDCSKLVAAHTDLAARHKEVEDYVRAFLGAPDYALDPDASLVLDPARRGYPTTREERDSVLRGLVHFQMSNYLSSDQKLDEAKRRLVHRYELRTKRFSDLSQDDLYAGFLDAFASSLDPHSSYLSPDLLEDFRISMSLSLEGIGVALSERDGYAVVERVIQGGAADRKKELLPNDKFIAVAEQGGDWIDIIDMPLRDAVKLIRGPKGTSVRLTVLREGEKTERFPITIERDTIDLAEQAAKLEFVEREVDGKKLKLGVLELPSFYGDPDPSKRQSTDDVAELLRQAREARVDGLLLDLSRNGGGLLEHAVAISGYFIRRGEVVGIRNAQGQQQVLADRDDRILYEGPLVVHTSRASASASEILAGALKDYQRAVIVGDDHTYGKGTVQTVQQLPPGQGALKITTALFFRPAGRSTQNDGVEADVVVPSPMATDDFGEEHQPFALAGESIEPFISSYANATGPAPGWRRVSSDVVAALRERSAARQGHSAAFAELQAKLAEAHASDGVVHLADIRREEAERGATAANSAAPSAGGGPAEGASAALAPMAPDAGADPESGPTIQLEEALNVLADLVSLGAGKGA